MEVSRNILRSYPLAKSSGEIIHARFDMNHRSLTRLMSTSSGLYNPGHTKAMDRRRVAPRVHESVDEASDMNEGKDDFSGKTMKGEVLDYAINLRTCRPGTEIEIPYELTLTESLHEFWQSSFHSQDRIHTSTPFARALGLQDRVMPFSLVL